MLSPGRCLLQDLKRIEELASEVCKRENCRVYDVQWTGVGPQRILRVFIETLTDSPVTLEDCVNVSKGLNLMLDVEDVVPGGRYQLEVSSPGLDRRLRRSEHFQGALGKNVKIRLKVSLSELETNLLSEPVGKARQLVGELIKADEEQCWVKAVLKNDLSKEVCIPYTMVDKANVVF